jgi:hypothetical protein
MVEGFADAAMMTNQQPLSFGTDGTLLFDPLNFELPNLAFGAFESSVVARQNAGAVSGNAMTNGAMWVSLADALDADSIANDWAAFSTTDGTVHADWVVTLPGQYLMTNPICDTYNNYKQANASGVAACDRDGINSADIANYSADGGSDRNQLPLIVSSSYVEEELVNSNLNLWDREELLIAGDDEEPIAPPDKLGFSPGGVTGTEPGERTDIPLPYEVNVISFGGEDATTAVMSNLKLEVDVPDTSDRGWGRLDIKSSEDAPEIWFLNGVNDDKAVEAGAGYDDTAFTPVADLANGDTTDTAVVGFAIWQRSFAAQAGNYGRMIEHSTITSGSENR